MFGWKEIVDVGTLSALFIFATLFFARKKRLKPLLLYFPLFSVYAAVIILDYMYGFPIARQVATLFAVLFIVVIAVVHQADFKAFFFDLSKRSSDRDSNNERNITDEDLSIAADEIVRACQTMAKLRIGALIVIATTSVASHITETGTELNATISAPLLESIFNTKAPMHDGAVVVKGNRILAAGCFLPLSQSQSIAKNLGTRHRAGIGITEETDMITIILSEETGTISVANHGELRRFITPDRLRDILLKTFNISQTRKMRS
ncbi:MAG: DNA integrity scanning protein DisA nucleotide-binding domain protein [Christensenellaceae bacterium]|nr:DNA integrity scanning protein DisA nucleotide-binding domain protein [Christensenellaceae bacterium]